MHFYQINADLDTFVKNMYLFLNGNTLHIFFLHKYHKVLIENGLIWLKCNYFIQHIQ